MTNKLALVFPGQGSQYLGMGSDLHSYAEARAVFDEADALLGLSLSRLCFEGPEDELNDTINTQPAILTVSVAALHALKARYDVGEVAFTAGHSLGEYTALVAGGHISFADAVRVVRERGRLMKEAGARSPGGMVAVLGVKAEVVAEACRQASEETGTIVQVANHNSPQQTVISGEQRGLEEATELVRQKGARRVVRLAVSIASHSALMEPAAQGLRGTLSGIALREGGVTVVGNVGGTPLRTTEHVREELVKQLVSPVQWVASIRYILNQGVRTFVEIGPKDVLSRLIRRIDPAAKPISVDGATGLKAWGETM